MKFFANCHNLDELKKEYRRLSRQYHPDFGGDLETMKRINAEHDEVFQRLKALHNSTNDENHQTTETPEEFRTIIVELMKLDGLNIELCGCWLWISGDTKANREKLKALGCMWASKKKMWYWHHKEDGRRWSRGRKTMGEIRMKYGSQSFASGASASAATALNG